MNRSQNNDNQIELTDLALTDDQQAEVKGGPSGKTPVRPGPIVDVLYSAADND